MRDLLRTVLAGLACGALCMGLGAAGVTWLEADVYAKREARVAALAEELATVRTKETLTAAEACAIAEAHLLTQPIGRALAVHCDTPVFEPRGPRAGRLTGAVRASDYDNAILGGGFNTPLCLARTTAGWDVVGEAFRLHDCAIDVPEDAVDAAAVTTSATSDEAARKRAVALATLDGVRRALASNGGGPDGGASDGAAPDGCADLPALAHPALVTLSDAPLAGRAPEGTARSFGYGMNGCAEPAPDPTAAPVPGAPVCALAEAPEWVLLFDEVVEDPPVVTGPDTYEGGAWRATAKLVHLPSATVKCARPVTFALPQEVITWKSATVRTEYDRGVKAAVCAGVEALGAGRIALDPWWGC